MTLGDINILAADHCDTVTVHDKELLLRMVRDYATSYPYLRYHCAVANGKEPNALTQNEIRRYVLWEHDFSAVDVSRIAEALVKYHKEKHNEGDEDE
jgi:hypothetical protein